MMTSTFKHTQGIVLSVLFICTQFLTNVRCYNVSIKLYNKTPSSHQLVQQTFYELHDAPRASSSQDNDRNGFRPSEFFVREQHHRVQHQDGTAMSVQQTHYHSYNNKLLLQKEKSQHEDTPFDYYELHRDAGRVISNVVQNDEYLVRDRDSPVPQEYRTTAGLSAHASIRDNPRWLCLALGVCSFLGISEAQNPKPPLMTIFEWKQLEFDYESDRARQDDIDSGFFQPSIAAPIDVDVYYRESPKDNKVFVSIPRFQIGSPVTLATVSNRMKNDNPVLKPYPDWSWHRNPDQCRSNRLVSVYRMKVDECGRLWVLDTGRYGDHQTCPPQIIAFDLKTNTLMHKFEIPESLLESRSILVTLVVDNRDGLCRSPIVYVADCQTYSIIVHDVKRGTAWKATDKTMFPYPDYGTFNIQGDQFDLMDGVLGMALEPFIPGRDRKLFYHAMSSGTENWVYTSHLRNETLFRVDPTAHPHIFNTYRSKRPSQSCAMAIDREGIAYFGLLSETSVNCWHTSRSDYGKNIETVYRNPVTMQFPSGVKVINNLKGQQELWVMTSRFQKVATNSLNLSEVNFRINAGRINDLLQRSRCKAGSGGGHSHGGFTTGGYGLNKPSQ